MYELSERDGASRIGLLTIGENKVTTPTLLLIDSERFNVDLPGHLNLLRITSSEGVSGLQHTPWSEITDIHRTDRTLSGDPKNMANLLVSSRDQAGPTRALYIPGSGSIMDYAQMVYCGIDIFDATRLVQEARKGKYLTPNGPVHKSERDRMSCFCPACSGIDRSFKTIVLHNILSAIKELSTIRQYIARGQLRHLVEIRMRAKPEAVSVQRVLDRDHYPFFREKLGFTGGGVVGVSENTLHEPAVRAYREKLEGYRKPGGNVLVLLPCSARKPYSISKSHRLFRNVLGDYIGLVHEVIVTSPMGLVPREFENFHPASGYDISVTGAWSLEEMEMIRGMLSDLLKDNEYTAIINHTPYAFVSDHLRSLHEQEEEKGLNEEIGHNAGKDIEVIDTSVNGRPTSSASLRELDMELRERSKELRYPPMAMFKSGIFRNMVRFQFGEHSDSMLEETKVTGKFPFFKLNGKEGQIAMMVPKSNRISLTLQGAKRLADMGKNRVFIDDFTPTGDVFAVGVVDADSGIRVGDEVAVVHGTRIPEKKNAVTAVGTGEDEDPGSDPTPDSVDEGSSIELRAGGVAVMSGEEMVGASRGIAVKLRHRAKK